MEQTKTLQEAIRKILEYLDAYAKKIDGKWYAVGIRDVIYQESFSSIVFAYVTEKGVAVKIGKISACKDREKRKLYLQGRSTEDQKAQNERGVDVWRINRPALRTALQSMKEEK